MKPYFLLFLFIATFSFGQNIKEPEWSGGSSTDPLVSIYFFTTSFSLSEKTVYICMGKYSSKYHLKKNCRGLSNCSTDIHAVSQSTAKEKGRTLCGWED